MQVLVGLAVSDASLLKTFAEAHTRELDVAAAIPRASPHGTWGIGFHAHGEMLVRKGPLRSLESGGAGAPGSIVSHLKDVRARQVVLTAEARAEARKLEDCAPLRYRDWLFSATGADSLGPGFAERVQAELPTYAFAAKRGATADEAVMMLIMASLERMNARDTRDLTTRAIQRAIGAAAQRLRALAGDHRPELLALLHVNGHLFAFAIGRPMWVARFRGTGEAARPGRLMRHEHLRALLIGDRTTEAASWEQLPAGLAAEIDTSCELVQFPA